MNAMFKPLGIAAAAVFALCLTVVAPLASAEQPLARLDVSSFDEMYGYRTSDVRCFDDNTRFSCSGLTVDATLRSVVGTYKRQPLDWLIVRNDLPSNTTWDTIVPGNTVLILRVLETASLR